MTADPSLLATLWNILYTSVIVIALFGATIFVHEFGHYIVARLCGLVVETFSIGFGPAIWQRKIRGIVYKIGWIPFGGYVKLPQLDPSTGIESIDAGKEGAPVDPAAPAPEASPSYPRVAPWRKILVAVAGAVGNLVLAYAISWFIYLHGKPSAPEERSAEIGYVDETGAAWTAGLRPGDRLVTVAGGPVNNWGDILTRATLADISPVPVSVVKADGTRLDLNLETEKIRSMGIRLLPGISGLNIARVWEPAPDSPAARAGLRRGDVILSLDGEKVHSREHFSRLVAARADRDVEIVVQRDGQEVRARVRPAYDPAVERARIGIQYDTLGSVDYDQVVHPRPMEQMRDHATQVFRVLKALGSRSQARAAADAMSGPPAILKMFWYIIGVSFVMALWFTAFLNVNLAILNLLPIPVLDGGHVVFSTLEAMIRKPLNARFVQITHTVFAYLLIGLIFFLAGRDIYRHFGASFTAKTPPAKEAPQTPAPVPPK